MRRAAPLVPNLLSSYGQLVRPTASRGIERPHRTTDRGGLPKPVRKEGDIEARVVDDQLFTADGVTDLWEDLLERGFPANHVVTDAVYLRSLPWNRALRVDQGVDQRTPVVIDDSDLDDGIAVRGADARRFGIKIDNHEGRCRLQYAGTRSTTGRPAFRPHP